MQEDHNVKNEDNSQDILQTVSAIVTEIVNSTLPPSAPRPSAVTSSLVAESSSNRRNHEPSQSTLQIHTRDPKPTYELFRAFAQFNESHSDINIARINAAKSRNQTIAPNVPPTYSSIIKQGLPSLDIRRDARSIEGNHVSSFNRIPPPSYAEIHGVWSREISTASSEQILLGPDPIYIWCSHCATVVITVTQSQRSKFTHFTAAALCLLGCWPCAMLPYCMNSCKNIYHYCPDCNYFFGMYRPW